MKETKKNQVVDLCLIIIVVAVAVVAIVCVVDYPSKSVVGKAGILPGPYGCFPQDTTPRRDTLDTTIVSAGQGGTLGSLPDRCYDLERGRFSSDGGLLVEWYCIGDEVDTLAEIGTDLVSYRVAACDCSGGICSGNHICKDDDKDGYWEGSKCTELGFQPEQLDCDDTDSAIYPGAEELCNQVDDDCNGEIDEIQLCRQEPSQEICDGIDNDLDGSIDEDQLGDIGFCQKARLRPLNSDTTIFDEEYLIEEFDEAFYSDHPNSVFSYDYLMRVGVKLPKDDNCNQNQYNTHHSLYAVITMYETTGIPKYLESAQNISDAMISAAVPIPGGPPGWDATGCDGEEVYRYQLNELQGLRSISRLARVMKERGHDESEWREYYDFAAAIIDYYREDISRINPSYDKHTHFAQSAIDLWKTKGEQRFHDAALSNMDYLFGEIHSFIEDGDDYYLAFWDKEWDNNPDQDVEHSDTSHATRFAEYMVQLVEDEVVPTRITKDDDLRRMVNTLLFRIWDSDPTRVIDPKNGPEGIYYPLLYNNYVDGTNGCFRNLWSPYANGIVGAGWNFLGRHDDRVRYLMQNMTHALIHRDEPRGFEPGDGCAAFGANQNHNVITSYIAESLKALKIADGTYPTEPPQPPPSEPSYYISPTGSDSNSGDALGKPWKTFDHALDQLQPGDTLTLLDGVYTPQTTGLLNIDCSSGHADGEQGNPITIKAKNERQAHIKSDGTDAAIGIERCSYYDFEGIRGQSTDLTDTDGGKHISVIHIRWSDNINMKRMLGSHNNRYFNSHIFSVSDSSYVTIEESEAHYSHRHLFSVFKSHHVTLRRNYGDGHGYPDLPTCEGYVNGGGGWCSHDTRGADEAAVLYYASDSIIENFMSAGTTEGFQVHGGPELDNGKMGGHDNLIVGSISFNDLAGIQADGRAYDGGTKLWSAENNVFKDVIVYGVTLNGGWLQQSTNTVYESLTVMDGELTGIQARFKSPCDVPAGCSFEIKNSLIAGNQKHGIEVADFTDWSAHHNNLYDNGALNPSYFKNVRPQEDITDNQGHVTNSLSVEPTKMGLGQGECLVFVPEDSNMKGAGENGADIGANILYRYEDGQITSEPLWDPATGRFPCGVHVEDMIDSSGNSCSNFHERVNVNTNGCTLPYS